MMRFDLWDAVVAELCHNARALRKTCVNERRAGAGAAVAMDERANKGGEDKLRRSGVRFFGAFGAAWGVYTQATARACQPHAAAC
jgi:hypothetical protein